jgi:hypothetical protein
MGTLLPSRWYYLITIMSESDDDWNPVAAAVAPAKKNTNKTNKKVKIVSSDDDSDDYSDVSTIIVCFLYITLGRWKITI